ncbi:signal peptidase II [Galenea microaerophila]
MPNASATGLKTLWLAIGVVILDQLSKMWAVNTLTLGEPMAVISHLNFTLNYNEGAAFSFLSDMGGAQRWLFTGLALAVTAVLLVWLRKLPAHWNCEVVGINFVLGGAIGNVIDRVLAGKVTDFIDFYIGSWHYATFNVADMAISAGAFCLIVHEFWWKPKQKCAAEKQEENV